MQIAVSLLLFEGTDALAFRLNEDHVEFRAGGDVQIERFSERFGTVEVPDGTIRDHIGRSRRWVAFPRQDGWFRLYPVPTEADGDGIAIVSLDERERPRQKKINPQQKPAPAPDLVEVAETVSTDEPAAPVAPKRMGRPKGSRNKPKVATPQVVAKPATASRKSSPQPKASKAPRTPAASPMVAPAPSSGRSRKSKGPRPWQILKALKETREDRRTIPVEKPPEPRPVEHDQKPWRVRRSRRR